MTEDVKLLSSLDLKTAEIAAHLAKLANCGETKMMDAEEYMRLLKATSEALNAWKSVPKERHSAANFDKTFSELAREWFAIEQQLSAWPQS